MNQEEGTWDNNMPRKIPQKNRNGDCFMAAGKYISDFAFQSQEKTFLVHGIVTGQGEIRGIRFLHAWVENNNMVIDKSNGKDLHIPKDLYYALGNINPGEIVKYTYSEAIEKMLNNGHYGPWDIVEPPIEGL